MNTKCKEMKTLPRYCSKMEKISKRQTDGETDRETSRQTERGKEREREIGR